MANLGRLKKLGINKKLVISEKSNSQKDDWNIEKKIISSKEKTNIDIDEEFSHKTPSLSGLLSSWYFLFNSWFSFYNYVRSFNFKEKNENEKIPSYLNENIKYQDVNLVKTEHHRQKNIYVDGVFHSFISNVLEKIDEHTNIKIARTHTSETFKNIEPVCINLSTNYTLENDKVKSGLLYYKTPLSNLFHELILVICSRIRKECCENFEIRIKSIIHLFLSKLIPIYNKIVSSDELHVEWGNKIVKDWVLAINNSISDEYLRFYCKIHENKNLFAYFGNDDKCFDYESSLYLFVIPAEFHTNKISEKLDIKESNNIDKLYLNVQRLFFKGFADFNFKNVYTLDIPEIYVLGSNNYLNFLARNIIKIFCTHFQYVYEFEDISCTDKFKSPKTRKSVKVFRNSNLQQIKNKSASKEDSQEKKFPTKIFWTKNLV